MKWRDFGYLPQKVLNVVVSEIVGRVDHLVHIRVHVFHDDVAKNETNRDE